MRAVRVEEVLEEPGVVWAERGEQGGGRGGGEVYVEEGEVVGFVDAQEGGG